MNLESEAFVPAGRARAWSALNDPLVLRECIPGCETLEASSATELRVVATVKIGPVKARFKGIVTIDDIDPGNAYSLTGSGAGGIAGFAKLVARVTLVDGDGGTIIRYAAQAQVGGKLAQIGARVIDATAQALARSFFTRFCEVLSAAPGQPAAQSILAPRCADDADPAVQ